MLTGRQYNSIRSSIKDHWVERETDILVEEDWRAIYPVMSLLYRFALCRQYAGEAVMEDLGDDEGIAITHWVLTVWTCR